MTDAEIKARFDQLEGELVAQMAVVRALMQSHHMPENLQHNLRVLSEKALAELLPTVMSDDLIDRARHRLESFRRLLLRICNPKRG